MIKAKDCLLFYHNGERWRKFWSETVRICREIEEIDKGSSSRRAIYLIDIGAGSLEIDNKNRKGPSPAFKFFQETKRHIITVATPPRIAYRNAKDRENGFWRCKPFVQFKGTEFSARRNRIYNLGVKLRTDGRFKRTAPGRFKKLIAKLKIKDDIPRSRK